MLSSDHLSLRLLLGQWEKHDDLPCLSLWYVSPLWVAVADLAC